jgi:hypothetical protein
MEDALFPELPEDLAALNDEELQALLDEHEVALSKIEADDPSYIGDMSAEEVLAQLEVGVEQIKAIREMQDARVEAEVAYQARKAELAAAARPFTPDSAEAEGEGDGEGDDAGDGEEEEEAEVQAEADAEVAEEAEVVVEEEAVLVAAADDKPESKPAPAPAPAPRAPQVVYRRPPAPDADRAVSGEENTGRPVLIAASGVEGVRSGVHLDQYTLAKAMIDYVSRRSPPTKHPHGVEEKLLVASAQYEFPEERRLYDGDHSANVRKIREVGNPYLGVEGQMALVASGGLCAPLTPLYDIPNLAVNDRPVRDALPSFQAERGGISVPSVSTIGDISTAITVIEESGDAAGGTFATKSCQDLTCPTWTDVAIGIISHCREYGNLNARAWPEGISHENAITMAAHARTAEARLLDRIKSLSINVTGGAATLSAWSHFVYALTRTRASMRYVLRLDRNFRLRMLAPEWLPELLITDQVSAQFDRFMALEEASAHLRAVGVEPTWYKDTPSTGTSQGFSAETASTIDDFPDVAQVALFPEGTFLHLDGGVLELGIVRDSTLNSTNDYQVFGETFENVARIGPTQAARWASITICPTGSFPAAGTAISC